MKQVLRSTLLLFAAWVLSVCAKAENVKVDGIYYNLEAGETANTAMVRGAGIGSYSGSVVIPETVTYNGKVYSVTGIGDYTFSDCPGLTAVTIPNSVTSIGNNAFNACSGLTSISIPNSVTSIGRGAFAGCSGLTSIILPNLVTCVDEAAFFACSTLASVTIPHSVTSIKSLAFYGCDKLAEVKCLAEKVPETAADAFASTRIDKGTLYVEEGSVEAYKATAPWSNFGTFKPLSEAAGIESVRGEGVKHSISRKYICAGRVVIEKDGKRYSTQGVELR